MLPAQHKLTSPRQFRRTIKGGRRAGTRTVVVHMRINDGEDAIAATGPRFGLIVSKAVGNAVVRHRTSRRLRHVCMAVMKDGAHGAPLPPRTDIVIRALPASAEATSERLERDIRKALAKWDI
ncbi:ribonuclease P protein component [Corynebacterium sp. HMSC05E07]|uniref:ribonuclease P protein component n=1 Tax=Corynebacterium sp. HMSC05E07 TaxID=1581117 RepID=UPI0008A3D198|nr:ribonuclease P protein component [Corynebacterium sp. HMSC05E07]OFT61243.1 ribonuclease P protein component [Corynebacterium sp. HMSC05E07]